MILSPILVCGCDYEVSLQVCGMTDFSKQRALLNKFTDILRHRFHCAASLFPNFFFLFCFIEYCKMILNNALFYCLIEILFNVFRKHFLGMPFPEIQCLFSPKKFINKSKT